MSSTSAGVHGRANQYDVVVIGGGHNGLVAAGLLAKSGQRVVVLERRDTVGGAAVTETPWGPDYKMTALSYVMSLMPPTILRELELERHGYRIHPQGPYFAPYPDGRHLQLPDDPVARHKEISKFSSRDADAIEEWDAWLTGLADLLGPMLSQVPPKVGSKRPGDLLDLSRLGWRFRGVDVGTAGDLTRLFTSSIADLLDDHFESPQLKGVLAVSGVIGTWAGPRSPGTAYVMVHHKVGDVGEGGRIGRMGVPGGRHGRGDERRCRPAASGFGAEVRTNAAVDRIVVEQRPGDRRGAQLGGGAARARGHRHHAPEGHVPPAARPRRAAGRLRDRHRTLEDPLGHGQGQPGPRPPAPLHQPSRAVAGRVRRHHRPRALARLRGTGVPGRGRRAAPPSVRSPTSASPACSTGRWPPRATTS